MPELIYRHLENNERVIDISTKYYDEDFVEYKSANDFQAYVNIMRGCNNFCSYCIVPYSRGREESRRPSAIIEEVENLVNKGVKEVTLLGQNVNSYGNNSDFNVSFAQLLDRISKIKGLQRLRFTTSHPKDLSDELIEVIKNNDNICNYFHLPLQSGSDKVLKDMNRKYDSKRYLERVEKLRKEIPGIAISTDIIVGYPTETEEDFKDTLELCKKVEYDSAYTFIYSPRPQTKASKLEPIEDSIVQERFQRLLDTLYPIFNERNKEYVGKTVKVLLESKSKNDDTMLSGRTDTFKLVHVKADESLIGNIVDVKIIDHTSFTLTGELI